MTYTFSYDGKKPFNSYLVYNGQNYQLNNGIVDWLTSTVTAGGVTFTATFSYSHQDHVAEMPPSFTAHDQYTYALNNNYDVTLAFSSDQYISHVKVYRAGTNGDIISEADNNTKEYSALYGRYVYRIDLTLSDTKPVMTYNITYNLDGGVNAAGNPATYRDDTAVTLLAPTRTNYDFGGWYDNSGFTGDPVTTIPVGASGDKTFWAKWTRKTYGYVNASGTAQTPVEAEIITSSTALTKLYGGWYVVPADAVCGTVRLMGNGTINIILCDGATLSVETIDGTSGSHNLVIWGQAQGTGTLDFQHIDGSYVDSVTVNSGKLICSSATSGYAIFDSSLTVNGGEVRLASGNVGSVEGSVAFNGGKLYSRIIVGNTTLNGTNANDRIQVSQYRGSVTVASGKYFKDENGRYYTGTLANWQKNTIKNVELQPAPNAHAVTVNSVTYGTLTADKAVAETGDTVTVTAAPHAGYAVGSVKYNGSNAARTDDTHYTFTMPAADVTVTGGMSPIQYQITYEGLEGAAFSSPNPESYTIESAAITLVNPTRTGYSFDGWTGTGLSEATQTVTIPAESAGDRAYTAAWTANEYRVSFDGNGATGGSMSMQDFTYDQAQSLPACAFTRTGYHFIGWNTAANGSGTVYTDGQTVQNLTAEDGAVVELYAQWEANTYTVHFDPVIAANGEMADQSFTYDAPQALTVHGFSTTIGE